MCNKMTMHYPGRTKSSSTYSAHQLLTVGLWLIVWVLFISKKDPQCTVCGETNDFLGNLLNRQRNNIERISKDED